LRQLRRTAVSGRRSALRGRFSLLAGEVRDLAWSPSLLAPLVARASATSERRRAAVASTRLRSTILPSFLRESACRTRARDR